MGSIHQNGDRLREPKVGDTRRPAAGPGSRWSVDWLCRRPERWVLVLSDEYLSLPKSVPVIPRCGHQICCVIFVRSVAWETGRSHKGLSFFRAWQTKHVDRDHQSWSRVGALFFWTSWTARTFSCFVSRSTFHKFPLFLFFFFSPL